MSEEDDTSSENFIEISDHDQHRQRSSGANAASSNKQAAVKVTPFPNVPPPSGLFNNDHAETRNISHAAAEDAAKEFVASNVSSSKTVFGSSTRSTMDYDEENSKLVCRESYLYFNCSECVLFVGEGGWRAQ